MPVAVVFYLTLKVFFVGDTLLVALNWLLLRHRPEQQLGLHPSILHPRAGYIHVRPRNVRGTKGRGGEERVKTLQKQHNLDDIPTRTAAGACAGAQRHDSAARTATGKGRRYEIKTSTWD